MVAGNVWRVAGGSCQAANGSGTPPLPHPPVQQQQAFFSPFLSCPSTDTRTPNTHRQTPETMQNEAGQNVDLYIPRKW